MSTPSSSSFPSPGTESHSSAASSLAARRSFNPNNRDQVKPYFDYYMPWISMLAFSATQHSLISSCCSTELSWVLTRTSCLGMLFDPRTTINLKRSQYAPLLAVSFSAFSHIVGPIQPPGWIFGGLRCRFYEQIISWPYMSAVEIPPQHPHVVSQSTSLLERLQEFKWSPV